MIRTPDTPNTLIRTHNRFVRLLQPISTRLLQQVCLLHYLILLQVPNANGLLAAVDVVALDDRVTMWSGGYPDLDLWVLGSEGWEGFLEEGARLGRRVG